MDGKRREDPPQITTHVCAAERTEFETYANAFGLDAAGLLALLLAREQRVGRLAALLDIDEPANATRDSKITVHGRDADLRGGIACAAVEAKTSVSRACAVLMRAELRERWLERSISTRFESNEAR